MSIVNAVGIDLKDRMFSCPVQNEQSTFQLLDEFGAGDSYAGLSFEVIDCEGFKYTGFLSDTATGTVTNHFAGPLALTMGSLYQGVDDIYDSLMKRDHYPLKITALQVRVNKPITPMKTAVALGSCPNHSFQTQTFAKSKSATWSSMCHICRPRLSVITRPVRVPVG